MQQLLAAGRRLRPWLDRLYDAAGVLAACFLVAILAIIVAQMVARWSAMQFPGSTDYAGYCMAAASFFALAHTLNRGAHIRVSLLLANLRGLWRRLAELWCFGVGTVLGWYFAYYAIRAVQISHMINDVSQGRDATPLWIPQLGMALGTTLFAIALTDRLVTILFGGNYELKRPGADLEDEKL